MNDQPRHAPRRGDRTRVRPRRSLTLSDEAWHALGELAGPGGSKSAVVERLILEAPAAAR